MEDLSEPQPDCPYPAFGEVTPEMISQEGTILTLECLSAYLKWVFYQEAKKYILDGPYEYTLLSACFFAHRLFTGKNIPTIREVSVEKPEGKYTQTDRIFKYDQNDFPSREEEGLNSICLWHGGLTLANSMHIEDLLLLTFGAFKRESIIFLGLERDQYLDLKQRTYRRPWPLIVTISGLIHFAERYDVPLKVFIMPPIPSPQDGVPYDKVLSEHYYSIYRRFLRFHPQTYLVTTEEDKYTFEKIQRMIAAGLSLDSFRWVIFPQRPTSSTSLILERFSFLKTIGYTPSSNFPERNLYETMEAILIAEKLLKARQKFFTIPYTSKPPAQHAQAPLFS